MNANSSALAMRLEGLSAPAPGGEVDEVDRHRKTWFEDNPLPMWTFDPDSYAFLDVNEASIRHYGYTRQQFLKMTIKDIRPPEDVPRLVARMRGGFPGRTQKIVGRHLTRDGRLIDVEIYAQQGMWNGRRVEIVQ